MSLQLRQNLKLVQQLIMTPQLQQAIKLLQLSKVELVQAVQQALLENPVLEERQVEEGDLAEMITKEVEKISSLKGGEKDLLKNAEWDDYLGVFSSSSRQQFEREVPSEAVSFELFCSQKPSLTSHLTWQLCLSDFSEQEKEVGKAIIGNLDSRGYLQIDLEELSRNLACSMEQVESVLKRIQRFDPVGVGARSIEECLLVQVEFYGKSDPVLIDLISNHFHELERKKFQHLAKELGISQDKLKEYLEMIRGFDPYPGNSFGGDEPVYISPDAYIYKYDNEFVIVLSDDDLPDLQLNPYYLEQEEKKEGTDKKFLQDKIKDALWLIKSLHQRQRTLYRVLESIVKFQRDFFEKGITHLKPLILKDVAEDVDVHESTVSRITTNKYVSTPQGLFELKFFFNTGLGMTDGSQMGAESVRAVIRKLITEENPKKPLSDKKIAELLEEKLKVKIARRTVAKYREAMCIPSSSKRKHF